jgi:hypothetical protein
LPVDPATALTPAPPRRPVEDTRVTGAVPDLGGEEWLARRPDEIPDLTRPTYRLASPRQVGLTAFLGGPLGGFLLMSLNYRRSGRSAAAWATVAAGVLVTVIGVGGGVMLPDRIHGLSFCVGIPLWIGTYLSAKYLQSATFDAHRTRGGPQASGWAVVGFTLLGIFLTLGGAFGAVYLFETGFGDRQLQVNAVEEVYYGLDVSEAEARTLVRVLQEQGFFDGAGEKSVRLHRDGPDYVLIIFLDSRFEDPDVHQMFRDLAGEFSQALGGRPVRVELCDTSERLRKTLTAWRTP